MLGPEWPLIAFRAQGRVMTASMNESVVSICSFSAPEIPSGGREFIKLKRLEKQHSGCEALQLKDYERSSNEIQAGTQRQR